MEDILRELPPLMRMLEPTEEERAAMAPELEETAERDAQIAAGALAQETAHLDIPQREAMSEYPATYPNIWSEAKVREYLGFPPESADTTDAFSEFAADLLVEAFPAAPRGYYYAEQFACGSVILGVQALWHQWPTYNWPEFADWLAGSAPGMGSSRRDFLMAGGDFMRVWREISALREEVHDMGVGFDQ